MYWSCIEESSECEGKKKKRQCRLKSYIIKTCVSNSNSVPRIQFVSLPTHTSFLGNKLLLLNSFRHFPFLLFSLTNILSIPSIVFFPIGLR